MKRFIFGERNGIYIIDLAKTLTQLRLAISVVQRMVEQHKSILFCGTKKAAKAVVKEEADRAGEFYVSERWLGGMCTNLPTMRNRVKTLDRIEKRISTGGEGLTKKELSLLTKEQAKLERNLSGIRGMRKLPGLLVVVDPSKEYIAVAEAKKLNIPVMAIVDTNCDPDPIDYVIPSNDDSQRAIKLIIAALCDAVVAKKNELHLFSEKDEEEGQGHEKEKGSEQEEAVSVDVEERAVWVEEATEETV